MQELLTMVTHTRRSFMGRDLDALMEPAFASTLEHLSGVAAEELRAMTFDAHATDLTAIDQPKLGSRRWVLPKVSKNRRATEAWLQFCTSCLQEDATPYFRRHWRHAFVTTCSAHGVLLETHCPSCKQPFDFESYDIDHVTDGRIVPVTACSHCESDLRDHRVQATEAMRDSWKFERALCAAARRGWTRVSGTGWLYSHQVLDVLHRLLRQLRSSPELQRSLEASRAPGDAFRAAFRVPAGRFECWPVSDRHEALRWVAGMLRNWPHHFVEECTRFNVRRTALHGHRGNLPHWFDRVLIEHLYRPWTRPAAEETASVREAIRGAGQPETQYNVRRWLGLYCPKPLAERLEGPSPEQTGLFAGQERRRLQHERRARQFPSREEFEEVRAVLEQARVRKKRSRLDLYQVWCAALYHLYTHCPIAALPRDFPKSTTVRWYLVRWMGCSEATVAFRRTVLRRLVDALQQVKAA